MSMLGTAVANLRQPEEIRPAVRTLGSRHGEYGVDGVDHETVGAALIATLEKGLRADFTPDGGAAWLACHAAITAEMLRGAATS